MGFIFTVLSGFCIICNNYKKFTKTWKLHHGRQNISQDRCLFEGDVVIKFAQIILHIVVVSHFIILTLPTFMCSAVVTQQIQLLCAFTKNCKKWIEWIGYLVFCKAHKARMQWWKVTKYINSRSVFYFSISIFCCFILLLHYISERYIVLFTPLHWSDHFS